VNIEKGVEGENIESGKGSSSTLGRRRQTGPVVSIWARDGEASVKEAKNDNALVRKKARCGGGKGHH